MVIAFDAGSSGTSNGTTALTISHTCAGANRALVVSAECPNSTNYLATATVTYAGVSMGAPVVSNTTISNLFIYTWVLVNPPLGTNNIVVTPSSSSYLNVVASSWTGVDQTTPIDNTNSSSNGFSVSPYSTSITTSAGGVAVDMFSMRTTSGTLTTNASQTLIGPVVTGSASRSAGSYKSSATAMSWTFTATQPNVEHTVIALKAATGGGADATASGGTGTVTVTGTGGEATGGSSGMNAAADGGMGSIAITGSGGEAMGVATGSFVSDAMENNTGAGLLASTAVVWTWYQGAIGAAPTSTTHGTGTTNSSGVLTATGLPSGAGFLLVRTADSMGVYYYPGTVI